MHNMNKQQPVATIQDVAARAGVSAMTVSRVINGHIWVAEATRKRVEQVIDELGYVPNGLARGLLNGQTRTIALLVSDISNPFFTSIARGVEDLAQSKGYTVNFGNSDEALSKEQQYVHVMLSKGIDGVLLTPAESGSRKTIDFLLRRGTPVVVIDREMDGVRTDQVVGDSVGGARRLTHHLLALGHRRIALVNGRHTVPTAIDRQRGFLEALAEAGLAPLPELMIESNYKRDGGYRAAQQLLALSDDQRPTAIFAANNFLAVGVIEALHEAGLSVPEDIAIVCFDDIELASLIHPFLTVAAQPARAFGTIAAQFLIERIEAREPLAPRKVVLEPELIVRLSCGAIRGPSAAHTAAEPPAKRPQV